ncbi:rRNA maturation RNase YbeY [Aquimarina sp. BL5]|uniref:rRNA maturation RNase YbeY n=1 Tax=Aquimarina sp. BL5 TaxID=1714860 RepID=UPI000E4BDA15|nr:rRNA maturation RNase YbeY [Aquimarina sp. BL5]AXT52005.1 rRNA maturation RNase YbeY [Aquimarina sp. BL5]RKM94667.1 rRNA maturation RNase YbeY [Aquimarina sp. BL5]
MINFFYESVSIDLDEKRISSWIRNVIKSEGKKEGEISFIFCNDEYLLKINQDFLNHDTYTDIISFDNSLGNELHGDVFISHERVNENSITYGVSQQEELRRVIVHGVLHFCGFKDKSEEESAVMRQKENDKLEMFHVEHF